MPKIENKIRFENKKNEINVKGIGIHVYEYIKQIFANNLLHRGRMPKFISKYSPKHGGHGDGKRRPLTSSPFPAP